MLPARTTGARSMDCSLTGFAVLSHFPSGTSRALVRGKTFECRTSCGLYFTLWTRPQLQYCPRCCVEKPWSTRHIDEDIASNEKLTALESELDKAVYVEDEARVTEIRDEISRLQATSSVDILSANMKFYQAFTRGSLVDMGACWMQSSEVTCKHPLGPVFSGFWDVLESFGGLFAMGVPDISPTNIRISMRGSVALVTCEEHANLGQREDDENRKALATEWNENFSPEPAAIIMMATNIFEKKNGQWYLVHHVSSPANPL